MVDAKTIYRHPLPVTIAITERLFRLGARVEAALAARLEAFALTPAEWRMLAALYRNGPQAPSALADSLRLTRGGVTKLADRLRVRRLIVRAGAGRADRRYQTLALTGGGATLIADLVSVIAEAEADIFGALSSAELTRLTALLDMVDG